MQHSLFQMNNDTKCCACHNQFLSAGIVDSTPSDQTFWLRRFLQHLISMVGVADAQVS